MRGMEECHMSAALRLIITQASHLARRGMAPWSRQRRMGEPSCWWASSHASRRGQPCPAAQAAANTKGTVGKPGRKMPSTPSARLSKASARHSRIISLRLMA